MKQLYHYLPLSDEVRARSLYVLGAGSAQIPPATSYPPPSHPGHHRFGWHEGRVLQEFQVVYITRGSGLFETAKGGLRQIEPGDAFVLFPQEWHRYSPASDTGWDEYWLAFEGRHAADVIGGYAVSPDNPLLRTGSNDMLLREFIRVEEEIAEAAIGYQDVACARLRLIIALASASHRHQNYQSTDALDVIKRAKILLMEQIDRPTDMEALAGDLRVGYSWLRKTFRLYTGLPLAQFQMQLRVNHACELLKGTTLPVAEVGRRSGFASAYYFARVFRSKLGCTPTEYRLQTRLAPALLDHQAQYKRRSKIT